MLFLITNRKLIKNSSLTKVVSDAVYGGIDAVILREKDLSTQELLVIASDIKKIINDKAKLIVNTNIEVARRVYADGYHIGYKDIKKELPLFNGLVGVSVHSLQEAINAEKLGADYLLASHIFPTECKAGLPPKGIELIKKIKENVNIPIIALGGINNENIKEVVKAGADSAAVMSLVMESNEPSKIVKELKSKIYSFI